MRIARDLTGLEHTGSNPPAARSTCCGVRGRECSALLCPTLDNWDFPTGAIYGSNAPPMKSSEQSRQKLAEIVANNALLALWKTTPALLAGDIRSSLEQLVIQQLYLAQAVLDISED